NPWLLIGVLTSMILQVSITYIPVFQEVLDIVPLSIEEWGMILVGALIPTTIAQLRKVLSGD
nr:cation-translocating P-type ATPase C-terminal domain-containing protein [Synergistales bacterium]